MPGRPLPNNIARINSPVMIFRLTVHCRALESALARREALPTAICYRSPAFLMR